MGSTRANGVSAWANGPAERAERRSSEHDESFFRDSRTRR
jgi:hypothetical protein